MKIEGKGKGKNPKFTLQQVVKAQRGLTVWLYTLNSGLEN
jgi:hypothetical protein